MFSCNEKTKKSNYLSIYMYKHINIYKYKRQTDMRPGLLKGEWGQGDWYTGPSPMGDSPAVILCLGEPSTSLLPSSLTPFCPLLRSHSSPFLLSLILSYLVLWRGLNHAKTLPWAKGDLKRRPHTRSGLKKENEAPLVSTEKPLLL